MKSPERKRIQVQHRPEWLVSVQSMEEALSVASFDIDILDWKQPAAGPLAPVAISLWEQVAHWTLSQAKDRDAGASLLLSAALGESDEAIDLASQLPDCFDFAKVGPSGCRTQKQLETTWRSVSGRLPADVELVAVAYADHQAANCLPAETVLDLAAKRGFGKILIDTFDKSGGSSLKQLSIDSLISFAHAAHQRSIWWAIAGSIDLADMDTLESSLAETILHPNCVAMRGSVCEAGRSSPLSPRKLRQWQARIKPTTAQEVAIGSLI